MRQLNAIDRLLTGLGSHLLDAGNDDIGTGRPHPATKLGTARPALSPEEKKHAAALMRVNHAGEIAAQALYQGQAITARDPEVRSKLEQSAIEEKDHLIWCRQRVEELGETTSHLEPLWHWGSFSIGALAGAAGDAWSLGFIKETEDQVIEHLEGHLERLPESDTHSRAIIEQMITDERVHGEKAVAAGGRRLPAVVKLTMKLTAKVMTTLSYRM